VPIALGHQKLAGGGDEPDREQKNPAGIPDRLRVDVRRHDDQPEPEQALCEEDRVGRVGVVQFLDHDHRRPGKERAEHEPEQHEPERIDPGPQLDEHGHQTHGDA